MNGGKMVMFCTVTAGSFLCPRLEHFFPRFAFLDEKDFLRTQKTPQIHHPKDPKKTYTHATMAVIFRIINDFC